MFYFDKGIQYLSTIRSCNCLIFKKKLWFFCCKSVFFKL